MQMTFERFGKAVTLPSIPESGLPAASTAYLIDYGWKQSLSDSFAAAKDAAEFEGKLMARFDKIVAGTMSAPRTGGSRTTDPIEREFKRLVAKRLSEFVAKRKASGKPKPSEELQQVWLDRHLETHGDELRLLAMENIERESAINTPDDDDLDELMVDEPTIEA